jgi:hypothetical protein
MGLFDKIKAAISGGEEDTGETLCEITAGTPTLYADGIYKLQQSDCTFITIQGDDDACVQVAKGDGTLSLNITPYAFTEDPMSTLPACGVTLPEGSDLEDWDADCYCQIGVPEQDIEFVANTVDAIFRHLLKKQDGYTVSIYMET